MLKGGCEHFLPRRPYLVHELDLNRHGGGVLGLKHEVDVEVQRCLELAELVLDAEDSREGRYAGGQGLTLVQFPAQRKHLLWHRGCLRGIYGGLGSAW